MGEILERAEAEDIKDALHEAGAGYRQIKMADIDSVKSSVDSGHSLDDIITEVAKDAATRVVGRHR